MSQGIFPRVLLFVAVFGFAAPQAGSAQTQQQVDSLRAEMRALQARMDSASQQASAAPATRASGQYMNIGFTSLADFGWSSERDVRSLQVGDHDPRVRGFTIPNAEIALDGAVDPFFKGFANIVYKLDENGETGVELEEVFFVTTSLPKNFQLKAGQIFAEFGRQNTLHPHAWSYVDQPLVLNRMFGAEGFRSQGARLSWLLPTPWYAEAMVSVMNSTGETTSSFRSEESSEIHGGALTEALVDGVDDLLFVPRLTASFDPTETQTVLIGASAAFGPNNSGADASTSIYGADLYWKWKSETAQAGFPFVSLQTEVMVRSYDAAARASAGDPSVMLAAETLKDRGFYSQVLWGIRPRIVAGLRGEMVGGDDVSFDVERIDRTRISPNLTIYPTEFSKFRVQYNYDHRGGIGNDHSLWLQFEFLLGAHASHKF